LIHPFFGDRHLAPSRGSTPRQSVAPLSKSMIWPVRYDAWSDASKAARLPLSSSVPGRWKRTNPSIWSRIARVISICVSNFSGRPAPTGGFPRRSCGRSSQSRSRSPECRSPPPHTRADGPGHPATLWRRARCRRTQSPFSPPPNLPRRSTRRPTAA